MPPPEWEPSIVADLLRQGAGLRALGRSLLGAVPGEGNGEDLQQEVYLAALRAGPLRETGPWLTAVARRLAALWRRRERRRRRREERAARPEALDSAADTAATTELLQRVAAAVHELDEPFRTAVVLRFWNALPPRAIAARLDVPVNTVNSRLQRALGQLRARLDRGRGGRDAWALPLAALLQPVDAAATAGLAATVPPGAGAWLGGALLMSMQWKVLGGAAAVLLSGLVAWQWNALDASARDAGREARVPAANAHAAPVVRTGEPPPPGGDGPSRTSAAPAPQVAAPDTPAAVPFDDRPVLVAPWRATLLVVDHAGHAVADAEVTVWDAQKEVHGFRRPVRESPAAYGYRGKRAGPPLQCGSTDTSGRYSLRSDHEMVVVTVRKDGVGTSGERWLMPEDAAAGEDLLVSLAPEVTLRGQVLRADGAPARAVKVSVQPHAATSVRGQPTQLAPLQTDVDGRFTAALESNLLYEVRAESGRDHVEAWLDTRAPGEKELVLRFLGAFAVQGMLLSPTGEPAAGEVRLWEGEPESPSIERPFEARAAAGTDGRFAIVVPQPGAYRLVGAAPGHANSDLTPVLVSAQRPRVDVALRCQEGRTIRGRVVRAGGGPMPGIRVTAWGERGDNSGRVGAPTARDVFGQPEPVVTAADGTFEFTGLHPGTTWQLGCRPLGDAAMHGVVLSGVVVGSTAVELVVRDEDVVASRVRLRVLSAATAAPIGYYTAALVVYQNGKAVSTNWTRLVRDADGVCTWEGLPRTAPTGVIVLSAQGHGWGMLGPIELTQETHELELRLQPKGALHVRVVDANGEPARNVPVTATPDVRPVGAMRVAGEKRSGADGCWSADLAPGRYTVAARRDGRRLVEQPIDVAPGQRVDVTLRLPRQ